MEELALHILDLAENAIEAGAKHVRIEITENLAEDRLTIRVSDDGRGMSEEAVRKALDPFYTTRTTRRVGLGLSLLAHAAQMADGDVKIESEEGRGTVVEATFRRSHLDRAPLGDLRSTLMTLIVGNQEVDVSYRHVVGDREFDLNGEEIREALGGVALSHPGVLRWLDQLLAQDP